MTERRRFPPSVAEKLIFYVYRLIDPRNGETFYIGKGKGDRVFQHANGKIQPGKAEEDLKLKRIRAIKNAGLNVGHITHRHGIQNAKAAYEIEAALIDAYPGLANRVGGHGTDEFGTAHADEIVSRYEATQFVVKHKLLLISVGISVATDSRDSIYDATRYAWKINPKRASQAEYVLAHDRGVVIGVFKPEGPWMKATRENFPKLTVYLRHRVPEQYRKRGNRSPIRYLFDA